MMPEPPPFSSAARRCRGQARRPRPSPLPHGLAVALPGPRPDCTDTDSHTPLGLSPSLACRSLSRARDPAHTQRVRRQRPQGLCGEGRGLQGARAFAHLRGDRSSASGVRAALPLRS